MTVERVLFLDIDGVLNHIGSPQRGGVSGLGAFLDATHLPPLERALTATNARIVVSSSWRVGRTVEDLRVLLRDFGVTAPIVGATPVTPFRPRDEEIAVWLARHPEVATYAIVDDDLRLEDGPLAAALVRTETAIGLLDTHVGALIARLSLPYRSPWEAVVDGALELPARHPLARRALRAVARSHEATLVELDDAGPGGPLAVVPHRAGAAKIYATRWRFEEERMLPDAAAYDRRRG